MRLSEADDESFESTVEEMADATGEGGTAEEEDDATGATADGSDDVVASPVRRFLCGGSDAADEPSVGCVDMDEVGADVGAEDGWGVVDAVDASVDAAGVVVE